MPEEKNSIFDDKYQIDSTATKLHEKTKPLFNRQSEIEIDSRKYGIGKPRRQVIRAKIIHD